MKPSLILQTAAINDLHLLIASSTCKHEIDCLYDKLLASGIEEKSHGFWILDLVNYVEKYSPKFRKSLGFEGVHDFPDSPDSWQDAIYPEDKIIAVRNFELHVESMGAAGYIQTVRYRKKDGDTLAVVCHGIVTKWDQGRPLLMVGVHMPENGLYKY